MLALVSMRWPRYKGGMDPKQKGWLIYVAGCVGFGLVCLALTAAKCVASELPDRLFLFPYILLVVWVGFLSCMTLGTALAGYGVIWVCLNLVVSRAS
jgi:hypothetical protein